MSAPVEPEEDSSGTAVAEDEAVGLAHVGISSSTWCSSCEDSAKAAIADLMAAGRTHSEAACVLNDPALSVRAAAERLARLIVVQGDRSAEQVTHLDDIDKYI